MRHVLLLCGLSLVLAACQTPPPHALRTPIGEVRATSVTEAERVAELNATLREQLIALLPDSKPVKSDVWVYSDEDFVEKFGEGGISGLVVWNFPGRTFGGLPRIELPTTSMSHSLAHEWVHLLLGSSWSSLPGAIEEGLANELASQLTPPDERAKLRFGYLCAALGEPWPEERFQFTSESGEKLRARHKSKTAEPDAPTLSLFDVLRLPKIRKKAVAKKPGALRLYGLGTLLAERIAADPLGLRKLHQTCVDAGRTGGVISPEMILALADFETEVELELWLRAEREAEAPGALFRQPAAFARLVAEVERLIGRELDLDTVLEEMEPTYRVLNSGLLRIDEDEHLRQLFTDHWPSRRSIDAVKRELAQERDQASRDS